MKTLTSPATALLVLALGRAGDPGAEPRPETADLVLVHGKLVTMDDTVRWRRCRFEVVDRESLPWAA